MILARRIRINKPDLVLTEDGWVEEGPACEVCGFKASSPAGLDRHQNNQHSDVSEEE